MVFFLPILLPIPKGVPQEWKHNPIICHGLTQTVLEEGEDPEKLQHIRDLIIWGKPEVFEEGKKIIQILLKAKFAVEQSEVKGPAQKVQFSERTKTIAVSSAWVSC